MSCLLCTSEEAEFRRVQEIRSRAIDEELRRYRDEYRSTRRLLLLGKNLIKRVGEIKAGVSIEFLQGACPYRLR